MTTQTTDIEILPVGTGASTFGLHYAIVHSDLPESRYAIRSNDTAPGSSAGHSATAGTLRVPVTANLSSRYVGTFFAKTAFQGVVKSIDASNKVFDAQLWPMPGYVPKSDATDTDEADATFPIEAIDPDDQALFAVGSVFTWMTGYRGGAGIPRKWESSLRFRRLPPLSSVELRDLREGADRYLELFATDP